MYLYVGATKAKYQLYLSGARIGDFALLDEAERTHKMLNGKNIYKTKNEIQ